MPRPLFSDAVVKAPDPFDLELDEVAGPQPASVAVLEDAARAHRARAENVTGHEPGVACGVRDEIVPAPVHVREVAARALFSVDAREHLEAKIAELVWRDDDGTEARREVLAFCRPEPHGHLHLLEVACGPVVHDREAGDTPLGADDYRRLELVIPR